MSLFYRDRIILLYQKVIESHRLPYSGWKRDSAHKYINLLLKE